EPISDLEYINELLYRAIEKDTLEGKISTLEAILKLIAKQFKTQVKAILKDIRQKGYYAKGKLIKEQAEQLEG
ncbi:hypothetical protein RFK12_11500, partial [Streptococcus suis]